MYDYVGKRQFDLLLIFFTALFLLPLSILIAFLIKIFDPGPIFFKQKRVGQEGELFDVYKFRSMPVSTRDIPSDKVGQIKLTWVGKFIRRTNLDELPQLLNILKGDMSIVGPRPPLPLQKELIELRCINGAIHCRPGLTGLAQIKAFNGMNAQQKAALDGKYAYKTTFLQDIRIIFHTFSYLLKAPPVY